MEVNSTRVELVEFLDKLSQKCGHFFEKMQPAARTRLRSHTCGLRRKKEAEVNSASFHYFIFFHRLRAVKLCETGSFALRAKIARGLVQGSFAHMAGKIRFRGC